MNTSIALTNLGKYNEGELIFTWLSLPATDEEIEKAFEKIGVGDDTGYEEYFITDYETDIPNFKINEYENLSQLNEQMEELSNLQECEKEEVEAIIEATGNSLEEAIKTQQSGDFTYYSEVHSIEELAEIFVDDGLYGDIPENLTNYIDYEAIGRDLRYDYIQTSNGFINIY